MNTLPVYIVLLSYNNTTDTIQCIKSLSMLDYSNIKVIVIENSENPEPFEELKSSIINDSYNFSYTFLCEDQFNQNISETLICVKAKYNKGFSAGNNIALKYILNIDSSESLIWILNNDTVVLKDTLKNLVSDYLLKKDNFKLGIFGSKLMYYHEPNQIQAIGGEFIKNLYTSRHIISDKDKSNIDYIVGASMLVSKQFIIDVGLLSEDYFLYYEELDWVYRSAKKGYKIDYCPYAIVYHKEGATIGSSSKNDKSEFSEIHLFKSRRIFVKKFYKLGIKYYISSYALLLNRLRKGKFKLVKKLISII